jgi:luciferase family oxidoreductase group 1
MPGVASTSPPVLLAHVAAATSAMRIGSGGVMLPNHAPLAVAEQFAMLEALHPGRIDLGLGRAPGTDPLTAAALRRGDQVTGEEFPQELAELVAFFDGTFPDSHPYSRVRAMPGPGYRPAIWLLGSSDFGARLAGLLGLPFSFAHHFSAGYTMPALDAYRASFRPSPVLDRPHAMVAVSVLCAPSHAEAKWLAGPSQLSYVRLRYGRPSAMPRPEEAAEHQFTPAERQALAERSSSQVIGTPDEVRSALEELVARTGADELMITTAVHSPADRQRSYALVAEAWGLEPRG